MVYDDREQMMKIINEGKKYIYPIRYVDWEYFVKSEGIMSVLAAQAIVDVLQNMNWGSSFKNIALKVDSWEDKVGWYKIVTRGVFKYAKNGPDYYHYLMEKGDKYCINNPELAEDIKKIEKENEHPDITEEEMEKLRCQKEIELRDRQLASLDKRKVQIDEDLAKIKSEKKLLMKEYTELMIAQEETHENKSKKEKTSKNDRKK